MVDSIRYEGVDLSWFLLLLALVILGLTSSNVLALHAGPLSLLVFCHCFDDIKDAGYGRETAGVRVDENRCILVHRNAMLHTF